MTIFLEELNKLLTIKAKYKVLILSIHQTLIFEPLSVLLPDWSVSVVLSEPECQRR
jgi:hypothetical protein